NSAGQAAVYFSRYAKRVHILVRGDGLGRTMSRYLIDQIEGHDNIDVHSFTEVCQASGDEHLEQLVLKDTRTGATRPADTSWLFIFIGAEPRTDWLDGVI